MKQKTREFWIIGLLVIAVSLLILAAALGIANYVRLEQYSVTCGNSTM